VGVQALQSIGVSNIAVDDMGCAEAAAEGAVLASWKYQELKAEKKRKPESSITYFDSSTRFVLKKNNSLLLNFEHV